MLNHQSHSHFSPTSLEGFVAAFESLNVEISHVPSREDKGASRLQCHIPSVRNPHVTGPGGL